MSVKNRMIRKLFRIGKKKKKENKNIKQNENDDNCFTVKRSDVMNVIMIIVLVIISI